MKYYYCHAFCYCVLVIVYWVTKCYYWESNAVSVLVEHSILNSVWSVLVPFMHFQSDNNGFAQLHVDKENCQGDQPTSLNLNSDFKPKPKVWLFFALWLVGVRWRPFLSIIPRMKFNPIKKQTAHLLSVHTIWRWDSTAHHTVCCNPDQAVFRLQQDQACSHQGYVCQFGV